MSVNSNLFSSSAEKEVAGFRVYAYDTINKFTFTKTSTDTYTLNYYVTFQSDYGGSSTSSRVRWISFQIYIEDTRVLDIYNYYNVGSPDIQTIDSVNYATISTTISGFSGKKIRIYSECEGSANSNSYNITTYIDQTFYVYIMDNDTQLNSSSIVITNTTTNNKLLILPTLNSTYGSLYFFKNLSSNYIYITTFETQTIDETNYNIVKLDKYNSAILTNKDSSKWYVCTLYNGNMERRNKSAGLTPKDASPGVNIFDAGIVSIDSGCTLPNPTTNSGKMCIVVYSGAASYTGGLLFTSSVNTIDNDFSNNSDNKVYLYADTNYKSTGIIFVSNGTYWCIMGWYNTNGIDFNDNVYTTTVTLTDNINSTGQINIRPTSSGNEVIKLPAYSSYTNDGSQFLILKTGNKTGGERDKFITNGTDKFGTSSSAVNDCINVFRRNAYACTIIVSRKNPSSNFLEYFPVSNY